jgi:prophage regulatory protein
MASQSRKTESEVVGFKPSRPSKRLAENYAQQGIEPLLNMDQVLNITKWSRSTLYNRVKEGFPKPIRTGPRTRAWDPINVRAYLAACRA